MENMKTKRLVESAILLALATVLSLIKLAELPYGGSVTIASMLPVLIVAYRYGVGWGVLVGAVHGVIQQLLGLHTLSYVTTWQSTVAVIALDYVVAFLVIGFGGAFRKLPDQSAGLLFGGLLACLLRYACHVISGATVWAGLSIPTNAALVYSFGYNATYMVPETIVLLLVAWYVGGKLDFRTDTIGPLRTAAPSGLPALRWIAGAAVVAALVFDTVSVFARLQNAETGDFDITGLAAVNWVAVGIVTAAAVGIAAVLLIVARSARRPA